LRPDHRPARALARARVGVRALPAHRQVPAVAPPGVGADLHQPLDVHGHVLAEVALDAALLVQDLGDAADLLFGEGLHAHALVDARRGQDALAARDADPVDVGERDLQPLLARKVDACDTCHALTLPLLVLLVRADDPHHSLAPDHLALDADLSDGGPDFHFASPLIRFVTACPRCGRGSDRTG